MARSMVSIEAKLAEAHENEARFQPNEQVISHMRDKGVVLGPLIGVSGVGKSYLIPPAVRRGGSFFSEFGNISSRTKRPSDPDNFRGGRPVPELLERIEAGELVQYVVHLSGTVYASDIDSYQPGFVLMPALTSALPQLEASGCFERIVPIGIVVDGATWENERMDSRIDEARLREALTCAQWLRARLKKIPILENKTGQAEATAQTIVNILRDPSHPHALDNLERVEGLLSELAAAATRHFQRARK